MGVGPNSSRILSNALINFEDLDGNLLKRAEELCEVARKKELQKRKKNKERKPRHIYYDGHQSRLGHYYRHLYQTVKYVELQKDMDNKEKYGYVKILRAQLSTHEQALLALNVLSDLGRVWVEGNKDFDVDVIAKYNLIRNIPKNFFDEVNEVDLSKEFSGVEFE